MARTLGICEKSLFFLFYFVKINQKKNQECLERDLVSQLIFLKTKIKKKSKMPREGPRFEVDFLIFGDLGLRLHFKKKFTLKQ